MKTLIKALFAVALCLPLTLSAQWTDAGAYTKTDDNVTIGTTNNTYSLYVRKDKPNWQGRFANRGGAGADVYLADGRGYGMHIRGWTNDDKYTLQLYNKTAETNIFYNNGKVGLGLVGNVGIGTKTPSYKLEVKGNLYANGGWVRVSGKKGLYFQSYGGGFYMIDNSWIRTYGSKNFYHNTGIMRTDGQLQVGPNGNRFIVQGGGNVGIGTTTPDNKLDVKGVIRAEEVKVELGWSDYVFYDDYQLPTLQEEELHIEAKGHLLGFESEVDMNGEIQIGDVSKRQQAKIEEMMLHLIDMNKKIEKIETENAELKAQLEAVKK